MIRTRAGMGVSLQVLKALEAAVTAAFISS